ncbi:zinc-binding dehydrogenase [Ramlibacter sp.]|uniref:zinc-binding dehydrogenase n=1 Tax=Ramlibacter sp. TaxID=1917967 RepID=UPI002D03C876|nr:zinc-binding dehydrogenase [Ramlibacter sp.]HWI84611.1 zinc-binding dehydrogenase [Ramlibacter sp.]
MQAYWMDVSGDSATLQLRDVAKPQAGPGQVLVRVHAAALNRGEFITGHGLHAKPGARPIGLEAAGEVAALGAGVSGLQVGQRVMGRCPGAFAEYALMDGREAMPVPDRLSWEQAAALPLVYQVAYDLLVLQGRLAPGEWVLVNGVSSGVGVASLQLAKALGARVIGTSGAADKLARLRELGLDVALCTRAADFHGAVLEATGGRGVDLAVNNVGGSVFAEEVRCLAFQGRLGMVGYVDGQLRAEIDIEALHAKRLTLFGVSNKLRSQDQRAAGVPGFVRDVVAAVADGRITPVVDRVFPFAELEAAREHMNANRHLGKIVLASGG